jgi:hypothetical protein
MIVAVDSGCDVTKPVGIQLLRQKKVKPKHRSFAHHFVKDEIFVSNKLTLTERVELNAIRSKKH